ncbi:hypothetical protein KAX21_05515, partial [candidate division WOR-3 bacterium]|nr:hypothetical protein [candidate division WOR-3 bacterium]
MKQDSIVKRAVFCIGALFLALAVTECKVQERYLVIAEEGKVKEEIDLTGWESGEEFVGLYPFYYPWQGEDTLDWRIDNGLMWVNGKLIGADLEKIAAEDVPDPEAIISVSTTREHLAELGRFPNLIAVAMQGEIEDADLEQLKTLSNLKVLYVSWSSVTDAGLAHLTKLANLRVLELLDTDISDTGLTQLEVLKHLRVLNLTGTDISDVGAANLGGFLKNLRVLYLVGTRVTDAGLARLKTLKKLRELHLSFTRIADAGCEHLAELDNISELYLPLTKVTDEGVAHLACCKNLRVLWLGGTKITDEGLKHLKGLKNLE